MEIYEYRIWERRHWRGHITHWTPIFATSDLEAMEVVKTRVDWDALIADANTPEDVAPLDRIRSLAAHGRMDAGVFVYDYCLDCGEPYIVRATSPVAETHECAAVAGG